MADWLGQTPVVLVALGVLFAPGLLIGGAARLRGLTLLALAPLVSTAALGAGCLLLGMVGIGWNPLNAAATTLVFTAAAAVLGWFAHRRDRHAVTVPRRPQAVLWAGICVGMVLTTLRIAFYIADPTSLSQTNDATFHLSALRFAVDTGLASPLQISSVIGASGMYPSGWHILAALVPQLTGTSVEVAANVVSTIIAGVVWPLGIALLVRSVSGIVAAAIAAAAAGFIPVFPLVMLQWGILYPQLLAVALLPAAIATVAGYRETVGANIGGTGHVRALLLIAASMGALLLSQPSVLLAWAVSALLCALAALIARRARLGRMRVLAASVAMVAATAATMALWWYFAHSIDGVWPPSTDKATALMEVLANGYLGYPWAIGISILMIAGIAVALRSWRHRWLVASWGVFASLYIVAVSVGAPVLRLLLIGPWYQDAYRLGALMPTFVLPLAAVGAASVVAWTTRRLGTRSNRAAVVAVGAVAVTGAASLVVAPQIQWRDIYTHRIEPNLYATTDTSYLTTDELALLRRLDQTVPADAVVVGNPSTGAAFGYAISGRNVIPRTWSPPPGPEFEVLWVRLRDVADDARVCPALDAFGARYVLDFGPGEEYPGRWQMPGFDDLESHAGFQLVDRQGAATLWRVTACD